MLLGDGVAVMYEEGAAGAAREAAALYPGARAAVESALGLEADFSATLLLSGDREGFAIAARSPIVAAYAQPERYLMVLDNSRVLEKPFTLETTLRHELCHLVLHHHIREAPIPRWLEEGVCQWASGGVSEVAAGLGSRDLARASLAGRLIPLARLGREFPEEDSALRLAYAQSRSFVDYLAREGGGEAVRAVVGRMRQGATVDEAFAETFFAPVHELEEGWQEALKRRHNWLSYLSDNIYVLLFVLGGALTVYGFARVVLRLRAREEDDGGDGEEGPWR
ncbi:MAG: hypothetical protein Kow0025_15200 [Thermodesulfovibrionales bacterium]